MSMYLAADYTEAIQALMPQGLAWPRDPKSVQAAVCRALAKSFERSDTEAQSIISGAFPPTATIMLKEWENALGLPDDCSISEMDSISMRRRAVTSKFISTGGLSRSYYINVAAALGYTITITQFRPAVAGQSVCGDPINGEEWPFTWRINAPETTIKYAFVGLAYCGDPLASWGNKHLECALNKIAPSHLNLLFSYSN